MQIEIKCILLCETFLNNNNVNMFGMQGYNCISKHRQLMTRGGVASYIENDISLHQKGVP